MHFCISSEIHNEFVFGTTVFVHTLQLFTVSENKALCHPASVDSLSTSAGTEDHVSMGCFAARKAIQVSRPLENHFILPLFILPTLFTIG